MGATVEVVRTLGSVSCDLNDQLVAIQHAAWMKYLPDCKPKTSTLSSADLSVENMVSSCSRSASVPVMTAMM